MDKYYWTTREAAIGAGAAYADKCMITAEMEPFNGWVCVLHPYSFEFFLTEDLHALQSRFELAFDRVKRMRRRPDNHRAAPPLPSKETEAPVAPKWRPGDKLPWE